MSTQQHTTKGRISMKATYIKKSTLRWPNSYAKACLTQKFAKFLCANEPKIAIACKVGTP